MKTQEPHRQIPLWSFHIPLWEIEIHWSPGWSVRKTEAAHSCTLAQLSHIWLLPKIFWLFTLEWQFILGQCPPHTHSINSVQQIIPHLCSWLAVLCSWVAAVVTVAGTLLLYCKHFHSWEPGFPHGRGGTRTTWQTRGSKKEKKHCFCILHTYTHNYSTWFIDCWVLYGKYPINVSSVSHRMAMYQCSLTELCCFNCQPQCTHSALPSFSVSLSLYVFALLNFYVSCFFLESCLKSTV